MSSGPRRRRAAGELCSICQLQVCCCDASKGLTQSQGVNFRVVAADDGDLRESLLAEELDSSAPAQQRRQPQQQQALVVHRPFNLEDFIRCIVQSWLACLSKF